MKQQSTDLQRRRLLRGAAALAGTSATLGLAPVASATVQVPGEQWDHETDVVCVGSGAAALVAAVTAASKGAQTMVLERLPMIGGTTGKSSGVAWIPNNPVLQAAGVVDERAQCLQYLARYAYPQRYTPHGTTLGLSAREYALLEAFYDHGSGAIDHLQKVGAVQFRQFRMWDVDTLAPDYADHLRENRVPRGRALEPSFGASAIAGGASLVAQLEAWLVARKTSVLTEHRVTAVVKREGRVVGVEAEHAGRTVRVRARRGVVFGTGGFSLNAELCDMHDVSLLGSCAMAGSTGDFMAIASAVGARMGPLQTAWRTEVVLDEALENRIVGFGAFVLPGDSMVAVNKYGRRIVNEKCNYNDRTKVHFVYDPVRKEYPNQFLFMVFDARSLDAFGGAFPFPTDPRGSRFMIRGENWSDLGAAIDARLEKYAARTGGFRLDASFVTGLAESAERFNGYARTGRDLEFQRGLHQYDADWHRIFSARRSGTTYPVNPMPSPTMHPFTSTGPYYAFILAAGALDTNGGPLINEFGEVLDSHDRPIPGLYGAGNCIACPSREAYYGAGGTIGLALTFGYIAGMAAATSGGNG